MKIDDLFENTSVDKIAACSTEVEHSLEQWIEYQRAAGFHHSFCFSFSYFPEDSDDELDAQLSEEDKLPEIDTIKDKIEYAMEIYAEKYSDVHISIREWQKNKPEVDIDFCVMFNIRQPNKFLKFITYVEDIFDRVMSDKRFLGFVQFRYFDDYKKPERQEIFYTAQVLLTALRYGLMIDVRNLDILDMRLKETSLETFKVMSKELDKRYMHGFAAWNVADDVSTLAIMLTKSRLFSTKIDDICVRILSHCILKFIMKCRANYLNVDSAQKYKLNVLENDTHCELDKIVYETVFSPDSPDVDFNRIYSHY